MIRPRTLLIFFLLGSALLYGSVSESYFVSDDWDWLHAASGQTSLARDFSTNTAGLHASGGSYNPVSTIVVNTLFYFFKLDPAPYHWVNIFLHGATAWLVAFCALALWTRIGFGGQTQRGITAVGIAAGFLFLVWPTHAEAVVWISSMPHLLATFFYCSALYLFFAARDTGKPLFALLCGAAALGAFFSKEAALSLPLVLLALEFIFPKQTGQSRAALSRGLVLAVSMEALVFLLARYAVTHIGIGTYADESLLFRPAVWGHTFLTFFEEMLTMGVARRPWSLLYFSSPLSVFAVTSALIASLALIKKARPFRPFLILFVLSVLPYIPLGFNRLSSDGERYTYLPSVFFCIALAGLFASVPAKIMRGVFVGGVAGICIFVLCMKLPAWKASGKASYDLLLSFEHFVDTDREYVFVALPDTISGAHAFRNGLPQAVELLYPDFAGSVVLMPVYTQPETKNYADPQVVWSADDRGYFVYARRDSLLFTGRDRAVTDRMIYELWGYRYDLFSSDTVRLIFSDDFKKKLSRGTAELLTLRDGGLSEVSWTAVPAPAGNSQNR